MFHGHMDDYQKPPLRGRPNTKLGDRGISNAYNRWLILFYHVWGPAWIGIHWISIWSRARSHYTWGSVTTLHDFGGVLGQRLITVLGGPHNFTVTALDSCVKWLFLYKHNDRHRDERERERERESCHMWVYLYKFMVTKMSILARGE